MAQRGYQKHYFEARSGLAWQGEARLGGVGRGEVRFYFSEGEKDNEQKILQAY